MIGVLSIGIVFVCRLLLVHILLFEIVAKLANIKFKLTSEFNDRQRSKLPEINKTLPVKAISLIFRKIQNSNLT